MCVLLYLYIFPLKTYTMYKIVIPFNQQIYKLLIRSFEDWTPWRLKFKIRFIYFIFSESVLYYCTFYLKQFFT